MEYIIIAILTCIVVTIVINKNFINHYKQKIREVDESKTNFMNECREYDKERAALISLREEIAAEKETFVRAKEAFEKLKANTKELAEIDKLELEKQRDQIEAKSHELQAKSDIERLELDQQHKSLESEKNDFNNQRKKIEAENSELRTRYARIKAESDELQKQFDKFENQKVEFEAYRTKVLEELKKLHDDWARYSNDYRSNIRYQYSSSFYSTITELKKEFQERRKELEKEYTQLCDTLEKNYRTQFEEINLQKKILLDKNQSYPFAANILADAIKNIAIEESNQLLLKRNPARKAADAVREYAQQLKQWTTRAKLAENQLAFYEELFPWLEEFKEIPPNDAWDMVKGTTSAESEYDHYKNWLSPEEYNHLSKSERNQLALDRYKKRHKSNWEIGIEYERYVGYKYEMRGFRVSYIGATQGLEDMGRDLVAQNGNKTYIIQCKRWAQEKTIHEKHIFQLYGTTVLYRMSHPKENIQPLFVTTANLSDTAKEVADYLNITIVNNYIVEDYPLIKCNIGKDGEKIYHLPFDQQYDHVVVSPSQGEGYAYTIEEAERLGFRHAYRWHSA